MQAWQLAQGSAGHGGGSLIPMTGSAIHINTSPPHWFILPWLWWRQKDENSQGSGGRISGLWEGEHCRWEGAPSRLSRFPEHKVWWVDPNSTRSPHIWLDPHMASHLPSFHYCADNTENPGCWSWKRTFSCRWRNYPAKTPCSSYLSTCSH